MLKQIAKSIIASKAGWQIARRFRTQGITVLMYHRVNRERDGDFSGIDIAQFRQQMQWLKEKCRPIAPEEFDDVLDSPKSAATPVLVTFDDGYRDFHDNAYPILEELKIPSIVFLATKFIDQGGMIWTDAVAAAVTKAKCASVELPWNKQHYDMSTKGARNRCRLACTQFLKGIPDAEREAWQTELFKLFNVDLQELVPERQMLSWDEVRATMPLARFGGHTHNHPILSQLDGLRMEEEIKLCHERISEELCVSPQYFAYPNGRAQDFTDETVMLLKKYGFKFSFSTIEGIHTPRADVYSIRRQPTGCSTLGDFASLVMGR